MVNVASRKRIRIPEFGKFLLVGSGILGFGVRNIALGIRNLFNDWTNPESKFTDKDWNPVPGIRNPWRAIQNPRLSWIPSQELTQPRSQVLSLAP